MPDLTPGDTVRVCRRTCTVHEIKADYVCCVYEKNGFKNFIYCKKTMIKVIVPEKN